MDFPLEPPVFVNIVPAKLQCADAAAPQLGELNTAGIMPIGSWTPVALLTRAPSLPADPGAIAIEIAKVRAELGAVQGRLFSWLRQSDTNAKLFVEHPFDALARAGIELTREQSDVLQKLADLLRPLMSTPSGARE